MPVKPRSLTADDARFLHDGLVDGLRDATMNLLSKNPADATIIDDLHIELLDNCIASPWDTHWNRLTPHEKYAVIHAVVGEIIDEHLPF